LHCGVGKAAEEPSTAADTPVSPRVGSFRYLTAGESPPRAVDHPPGRGAGGTVAASPRGLCARD